MISSVSKHYLPRPERIRNSADDTPVDDEQIRLMRNAENAIGSVCTEGEVSVTMVVNE